MKFDALMEKIFTVIAVIGAILIVVLFSGITYGTWHDILNP